MSKPKENRRADQGRDGRVEKRRAPEDEEEEEEEEEEVSRRSRKTALESGG
jgi:hypothetical protein